MSADERIPASRQLEENYRRAKGTLDAKAADPLSRLAARPEQPHNSHPRVEHCPLTPRDPRARGVRGLKGERFYSRVERLGVPAALAQLIVEEMRRETDRKMTRSAIRKLVGTHVPAAQINRAGEFLRSVGSIKIEFDESTGGRPPEVWTLTSA